MTSSSRAVRLCVALTAGAGLLTGCITGGEDKEQTFYLTSFMRDRMAMLLVYPPREDVRVGDIFVMGKNPEEAPSVLNIVPRWDSIDLREEVVREYSVRRDFPATPPEYINPPEDPDSRSWPEPMGEADLFLGEQTFFRLRTVDLPSLRITPEHLRSLVPADAVNMASGGAYDWDSVVIRVMAAESYGVDAETVLDVAVIAVPPEDQPVAATPPPSHAEGDDEAKKPEPPRIRYYLREDIRDRLPVFPGGKKGRVWVRIVSEVLYMRAAQFSLMRPGTVFDDDEVTAAELGEEDGTPEVEEELDPAYAAILRAEAINEAMRRSGTDLLPDSQMRFLSVAESSVVMQRVWRRGIALGARGVTLEVDIQTGEVLGFHWMGGL